MQHYPEHVLRFEAHIHVKTISQQLLFALPFVSFQLEGYMDEMFIGSAFAAMGEHVINVKLIRHKASG